MKLYKITVDFTTVKLKATLSNNVWSVLSTDIHLKNKQERSYLEKKA